MERRCCCAGGDTTRWTVARKYPLVASSSSSPILTTKLPASGTASIHSPGATSTCSPFCSSCSRKLRNPRIFMGADALAALGLLLAGVADQFDMLVGFVAVELIESILRELQGFGKGAQQADAHLGHLLLPVK